MRSLRVGLFSNAYRPVVSGVVNSLSEIRKGLLKRHHTPFLFAPEAKGYREAHAGVFRFPSLELDRSVGFPVPIPFSARLSRLIPRMQLDVIHSHHPILIGATAANFARRLGLPLVYTFHTQIEQYTHYVPFFSRETVRDAARAKVSQYLAKCQLIICPSPSIRDLIDSYGVETRVETLPNAIDLEKFSHPQAPERPLRDTLGIAPQALVSLSVGRLAYEKGLPFLLKAFAATETDPEHHLVLVGSGPQELELRQLASELNIGSRVHFLGPVSYRDMPTLYNQADLFVICSTTEVKPLVVLEALASGLAILAVSACGTKDTLTHGVDGCLCELNHEAYVSNWNTLLRQPEFRTELGQRARATAEPYSIDSYLDRLCELYRDVLDRFPHRKFPQTETG